MSRFRSNNYFFIIVNGFVNWPENKPYAGVFVYTTSMYARRRRIRRAV